MFISSESAIIGLTKVCVYGSAKGALLGLTKCLAGDISADGIRVNAIIPGFIDTPMFHQAVDSDLPRQQKILGHDEDIAVKSEDGATEFVFTLKLADK